MILKIFVQLHQKYPFQDCSGILTETLSEEKNAETQSVGGSVCLGVDGGAVGVGLMAELVLNNCHTYYP